MSNMIAVRQENRQNKGAELIISQQAEIIIILTPYIFLLFSFTLGGVRFANPPYVSCATELAMLRQFVVYFVPGDSVRYPDVSVR